MAGTVGARPDGWLAVVAGTAAFLLVAYMVLIPISYGAMWFTFHPLFMTLAFIGNSYGFLHKVMRWPAGNHVILQCTSFTFFVAGLVCIWKAHYDGMIAKGGFPFFGVDSPWYKRIHIYLAYPTFLGWLVQLP